jgi:hypothetical protein
MQTYLVPLNPDEEKLVLSCAQAALKNSDEKTTKEFTVPQDRLGALILGARCELAVAKFLGYKDQWNGLDFKSRLNGDVASVEVKGTPLPWRKARLMLNERCEPRRQYIFCSYSHKPWVEIVGWQDGHFVMKCENKLIGAQYKEIVYGIPTLKLKPIKELLNKLWRTNGKRTE